MLYLARTRLILVPYDPTRCITNQHRVHLELGEPPAMQDFAIWFGHCGLAKNRNEQMVHGRRANHLESEVQSLGLKGRFLPQLAIRRLGQGLVLVWPPARKRLAVTLFSARLFTRAAAFTNTCLTLASSGMSALAAGYCVAGR